MEPLKVTILKDESLKTLNGAMQKIDETRSNLGAFSSLSADETLKRKFNEMEDWLYWSIRQIEKITDQLG